MEHRILVSFTAIIKVTVFFVVLVRSSTFQSEEISSLENPRLSQCGINSLYLCLKYHGTGIPLEDLYINIQPDSENNVSLKQLGDYAKQKGLYVQYVNNPESGDIQTFLQGKRSVLLQYKTPLPDNTTYKHIVALVKADNEIILLDYPNPKKEVTLQELSVINGNSEGMLILTEKPFINLRSAGACLIASGLLGILILGMIKKSKRNKALSR
jgi:ABC-type bacteriocin/lantibiotic exporter with double-glycine peptidase domain